MIFPPRRMADGEHLTAANYNALLDYVRRITPVQGPNVKVDYRTCGAVISGTPRGYGSGASIAPFTVRKHEGQWEIYLPDGCVNVGGTCATLNAAASSGGSDHEADDAAWRILGLNDMTGATSTDDDGNTYREWTVTVHAKTSAKEDGVDDLNAPARRLVWAGATDRLKSSDNMTSAERYKDTPGDTFTCDVARVRVTISSGSANAERRVTQLRDTPIDVGDVPAPAGFDLVWYFSVDGGDLTVEKVYCIRQLLAAAGIAVTGDQMTEVTDAGEVYARIDTADMNSGGCGIVDVVKDPEGNQDPTSSQEFIVWLPLYQLGENTVTADYRENSLKNVQIYRA